MKLLKKKRGMRWTRDVIYTEENALVGLAAWQRLRMTQVVSFGRRI